MADIIFGIGGVLGVVLLAIVVYVLVREEFFAPSEKPSSSVQRLDDTRIGIYVDGLLVTTLYHKGKTLTDSQLTELGNVISTVTRVAKENRSKEIHKLLGN